VALVSDRKQTNVHETAARTGSSPTASAPTTGSGTSRRFRPKPVAGGTRSRRAWWRQPAR